MRKITPDSFHQFPRDASCVGDLSLQVWSHVYRQLLLLAGCLLLPLTTAHAVFVPDSNGNPVWITLPQWAESESSPNTNDDDNNGVVDWMDTFNAVCANGWVTYWAGGTWYVDGVATTYGGVWHVSTADSDGDLIPDDLDPYPNDASNHSFYFYGGYYTVNGAGYYFNGGEWYPASADGNGNGVPDSLEAGLGGGEPPAPPTLHWDGGTFWLNGWQQYFPPADYNAPAFVDADGDGIPDELDPCPNDPWNGTSFYWGGGDYPVNGEVTHFPPGTYGGLNNDADNDGIPDSADPYPADSSNNSAWWQGGTFVIDGIGVTFPGRYLPAGYIDTDADGIPDLVDPLPYDPANMHVFTFGGGIWTINNQTVMFDPATFSGTWLDTDGDGIPDVVDPYPTDANNANVTQSYYWPGGVYQISNSSVTFPGGTYDGSWTDSDMDGIPDPADPYPTDANNGNMIDCFYWQGGTFYVNSVQVFFPAAYYPGWWNDRDGDGIPDSADGYPDDANNNCSFYWAGGTFRINDADQSISGGYFAGSWQDTDCDGIPDVADPYPADANNGGSTTTTYHWEGGEHYINNTLVSFPPADYEGTWTDADSDGIPDPADPYPGDPGNGNGFYWAGGTFRIADQDMFFASGCHPGDWSDQDGDAIPDQLDPFPYDANNGNILTWWAGGTWRVGNSDSFFGPAWLHSLADADGDGLPDETDPFPTDANNGNDPTIYWPGGTFTIDGASRYFAPGIYPGTSLSDSDGDGIPDVADPYPGDPNNNSSYSWAGGTFTIQDQPQSLPGGTYPGAWTDTDGDGIPDPADPFPGDAANGCTTGGGGGGTEIPPGCFYWAGTSTYVDGSLVSWPEGIYTGSSTDSDGDGIPDCFDLHSGDAANNSAWWPGCGERVIYNAIVSFSGRWHRADASDSDNDGLPDDIDPCPSDPENGSNGFCFPPLGSGVVSYMINHNPTDFSPTFYATAWADTDGDGIPDIADPVPGDADNGNSTGSGGGGGGGDTGTGGDNGNTEGEGDTCPYTLDDLINEGGW